jgi:hypothetical protein
LLSRREKYVIIDSINIFYRKKYLIQNRFSSYGRFKKKHIINIIYKKITDSCRVFFILKSSHYSSTITCKQHICSAYKYIGIPLGLFGNLGNLLSSLIFYQKPWRKKYVDFIYSLVFFSILLILILTYCYLWLQD